MKAYLKRFGFLYLIVAVLALVYIILFALQKGTPDGYVRTNTECLTQERVFDYADKLTDDEEASLRELIAEREQQIGCDIILLVLEEPVAEDARGLLDYADTFFEENKFGFDKPYGDGVLYLDNWYSYGDYNADACLSTSGRAEDKYTVSMIDDLVYDITSVTNEDPYAAYTRYVNHVYEDMSDADGFRIPPVAIPAAALLITVIYLMVNLSAQKGKKTTTASTYVEGGRPTLHDKQDVFVSKHVSSRKIESSSGGGGGGGGGHHISSGGHSHGGGVGHH